MTLAPPFLRYNNGFWTYCVQSRLLPLKVLHLINRQPLDFSFIEQRYFQRFYIYVIKNGTYCSCTRQSTEAPGLLRYCMPIPRSVHPAHMSGQHKGRHYTCICMKHIQNIIHQTRASTGWFCYCSVKAASRQKYTYPCLTMGVVEREDKEKRRIRIGQQHEIRILCMVKLRKMLIMFHYTSLF